MSQITVRNIDDAVVDRLKVRAKANGRSLEAEVRYILEQSTKAGIAKVDMAKVDMAKVDMAKVDMAKVDMATARQHVMKIRKKLEGRKFPDAVELIRDDRDR